MSNEELLDAVRASIVSAMGEAAQTIAASATINRGVCAGSVSYATKPLGTVGAHEVMRLVLDAYAANGLAVDLTTADGANLFARILLEAIKQVVSTNRTVNLVDRLKFEARLYANNSNEAWMCPIACSAEFNRLPSEVDLAQSPSFLSRRKREARKNPYDKPSVPAAGRVTKIQCPSCGTEIVIENTVD